MSRTTLYYGIVAFVQHISSVIISLLLFSDFLHFAFLQFLIFALLTSACQLTLLEKESSIIFVIPDLQRDNSHHPY